MGSKPCNMSKLRTSLTVIALFAGIGCAASATRAGTVDAALLVGEWTGLLPVPGGSRQVSIVVSRQPDGSPTAMLHAATDGLNNHPMRVISANDSVLFYADEVGCRFAGQPVANGQRLRGHWQQPGFRAGLVLDRVAGTPTLAVAPVPPPGAAPAAPTATYKTEDVRVTSPGSPNSEVGLGGTLRLPPGPGPFAAVVLLADMGAPAAPAAPGLLNELADYLTRQGMAVLCLDARGTGRSAAVPGASAGPELVADAQSALSFLRTRPGIDPARVGLLGHGEGANVALLAAAQVPTPAFVAALGAAGVSGQELLARQTSLVNQPGEPDTAQLAWARQEAQTMTLARREAKKQLAAAASPAQVQIRLGQEQLRLAVEARRRSDALYKRQLAMLEIIRQTPDNAQAQAIVANMLRQIYPALPTAAAHTRAGQLTSSWYRSFLAFNPQAELGKVSCPTLLLHGTADTQVPTALNLPLLEKGLRPNKHVNVRKLEGVGHDFGAASSEQALAAGTPRSPGTAPEVLEAVGEWLQQQVK